MLRFVSLSVLLAALAAGAARGEERTMEPFTNSVGMKLIRIEAGSFQMGQDAGGDWDERPVHRVTLSRPFFLASTEVTNAQYEQFDSEHRKLRGKGGFSREDDEAVVFVSWHDAVRFCEWLSRKEGKPYRLPTEAEWEYACRAGTTTPFHTGETLPEAYQKHQKREWFPVSVSLRVGATPPNAWGLYDLHGNVEEWCQDWYGPYPAEAQTDPVGRAGVERGSVGRSWGGEMKVTRGGSHNTEVAFLRAANRLGTLPDDRSALIGFRVAQGELPATKPLPLPEAPLWARGVSQKRFDWSGGPDPSRPFFAGPQRYVHIPPGSNGPLYARHNHCPSLVACPNGDLLAVWFSTNTEAGREMTIVASRKRRGSEEWDPAAEFFKAPDRNMTGSALWSDGRSKLCHFNGLEAAGGWANLALVMRTSEDNGVSWQTRLIGPEHQPRHQVISGTIRTREGYLIQACDAVHGGSGGTAIHISRDGGLTWSDPGAGTPPPAFAVGATGGTIAGIHAGVVQLKDGSLMALGRGNNLPGVNPAEGPRMPMSLSRDFGKSWQYHASPFPPISSGQRLVLMRLREGPLLLLSFTDADTDPAKLKGMLFRDAAGQERRGYGLYAALSFDDGASWPARRLVTPGSIAAKLEGGAWTGAFTPDDTHAEPRGYLAATQTPDGVVHLVSSALYYRFNLAWLQAEKRP